MIEKTILAAAIVMDTAAIAFALFAVFKATEAVAACASTAVAAREAASAARKWSDACEASRASSTRTEELDLPKVFEDMGTEKVRLTIEHDGFNQKIKREAVKWLGEKDPVTTPSKAPLGR
jgi:hypothetical protein